MVTRNADSSQVNNGELDSNDDGDGALMCELPGPADQPRSRAGNMVFKSGPLYISSKGIGWTSWKKRWFILTRTSLVFFRSDPSVIPQRGSEVNLTLGGIDLNNSGSVVIRADKKLLTVLFPDGRDGRAFTLKAETSEDLYEWKAALENALAQAPSAALVLGQNGIFRNDQVDAVDGSSEQGMDKHAVKSFVVGRPLLLALEDIDGSPSFLEKALRFVEQHGVKVEGILRQAADVEDVERRVREYEQGKSEFSPEEDPHVIADCVKHVLRELPSSPVPASCCNALLEACRTDRGVRVSSMRAAIYETFPEPNRHLLQRILMMMQAVASNKSENRMSTSAVAACMAPLLLRPLLAGDCEPENGFDMEGDSSVQLLQAAAAANHAQAIVITLLEDYDKIFGEDSMSPGLQSESEGSGSEDDSTDDDEVLEDDGYHDTEQDIFADADDDPEHELSGTCSEGSGTRDNDLYHKVQDHEGSDLDSGIGEYFEANWKQTSIAPTPLPVHDSLCSVDASVHQSNMSDSPGSVPAATSPVHMLRDHSLSSNINKSAKKSNGPMPGVKRPTVWGRTAAKKNLSMESIDYISEDDVEIQRLEVTRTDLQNRIAKEAKGNALLQASLERRKLALHERRLALERDVARLQEQLQREKELRAALEGGLKMALDHFPVSATIDDKTKAEIEEIALAEADIISLKQKVDSLHVQLSQQREENSGSEIESSSESQQKSNHQATVNNEEKNAETIEGPHFHANSTSQDAKLKGAESGNVRKQEPLSLLDKYLPQKQQLDLTCQGSAKSSRSSATLTNVEPAIVGLNSSPNVMKASTGAEGSISTTSALTKLTTRLNFLKERRNQIANELQNREKAMDQEINHLKIWTKEDVQETNHLRAWTMVEDQKINHLKIWTKVKKVNHSKIWTEVKY